MKLHPSVIRAVNGVSMDSASEEEACARRVLRAQAQPEAIPEETALAALEEYYKGATVFRADEVKRMRAALSAALLYIAGGE
jgi:hypothetical protein